MLLASDVDAGGAQPVVYSLVPWNNAGSLRLEGVSVVLRKQILISTDAGAMSWWIKGEDDTNSGFTGTVFQGADSNDEVGIVKISGAYAVNISSSDASCGLVLSLEDGGTPPPGSTDWHHVMLRFVLGKVEVFLDGALKDSTSSGALGGCTYSVDTIGGANLNGWLDEIAIFSSAMEGVGGVLATSHCPAEKSFCARNVAFLSAVQHLWTADDFAVSEDDEACSGMQDDEKAACTLALDNQRTDTTMAKERLRTMVLRDSVGDNDGEVVISESAKLSTATDLRAPGL